MGRAAVFIDVESIRLVVNWDYFGTGLAVGLNSNPGSCPIGGVNHDFNSR